MIFESFTHGHIMRNIDLKVTFFSTSRDPKVDKAVSIKRPVVQTEIYVTASHLLGDVHLGL